MTDAVSLEVVKHWIKASRDAVADQMLRGGTPEKIAFLQGSKTILDMLTEQVTTERFGATAPQPAEPEVRYIEVPVEVPVEVRVEVPVAASAGVEPRRVRPRSIQHRVPGQTWDEALSQIKGSVAETYNSIMGAFGRGPLTDDQLRDTLQVMGRGMVPGTVTARRGDLAWAGWLQYSGRRTPGDSGSNMKIWELAP